LALKRPLGFARKLVGLRQKAGGAQARPFGWMGNSYMELLQLWLFGMSA